MLGRRFRASLFLQVLNQSLAAQCMKLQSADIPKHPAWSLSARGGGRDSKSRLAVLELHAN